MDLHFFFFLFLSKTLQYVVKRSLHRNINKRWQKRLQSACIMSVACTQSRELLAVAAKTIYWRENKVRRKAHNAMTSSWKESSLWCPERSPYKIDIKSTARSVTKTFIADHVRLTCSKRTKRLACEGEFSSVQFSSVQIRPVQGARKSLCAFYPVSLTWFPNVALETSSSVRLTDDGPLSSFSRKIV